MNFTETVTFFFSFWSLFPVLPSQSSHPSKGGFARPDRHLWENAHPRPIFFNFTRLFMSHKNWSFPPSFCQKSTVWSSGSSFGTKIVFGSHKFHLLITQPPIKEAGDIVLFQQTLASSSSALLPAQQQPQVRSAALALAFSPTPAPVRRRASGPVESGGKM